MENTVADVISLGVCDGCYPTKESTWKVFYKDMFLGHILCTSTRVSDL